MPRGVRHVALSISFLSPMARRPDALFATNIASLIILPDLRFLALTSFQSLNRPSLSSGSSSRISVLKQSFSVSRPRLPPPGNIHSWSPLLLTNKTHARALSQRVSMTLPLRFRTASTTNHQCRFYSIPCTKKGTVGCKICGSSLFMSRVKNGHNSPPHLERFAINPNPIYGRRAWKKVLPPRSKPALS